MLKFLASTLRHRDYDVRAAGDGVEALEVLGSAAGPPADLIVLDLGLPRLDGFEVLELLRRWSQVPVVVLSALEEARQQEGLRGARAYLKKPIEAEMLLDTLRRLC